MTNLNIAGILEQTTTNGKGLRCAIFFQGCTHDCVGCHNKHLQEFGLLDCSIDARDVIEFLEDNQEYLDGVTLTGGEPLQQNLKSLEKLIHEIRARTDLNIWIYTGYTVEEIKELDTEGVYSNILTMVDVLVDGRFENDNLYDSGIEEKSYRGSKNQRLLNNLDIVNIFK